MGGHEQVKQNRTCVSSKDLCLQVFITGTKTKNKSFNGINRWNHTFHFFSFCCLEKDRSDQQGIPDIPPSIGPFLSQWAAESLPWLPEAAILDPSSCSGSSPLMPEPRPQLQPLLALACGSEAQPSAEEAHAPRTCKKKEKSGCDA